MAFVFVFSIASFFFFSIVSYLIFLSFIECYRRRVAWEYQKEVAGMSGGSRGGRVILTSMVRDLDARVSYSAASFVFITVFRISISFSIIKCDR